MQHDEETGPEGRYLLDFHTRDLPRYVTDTLVIGGGVAGLSAARAAAETSDVLVVLKDAPPRSNTAWAQGGIAAAIGGDDAPAAHAADTIATGFGLCDLDVVRLVTDAAADAIAALVGLGASFDRAESGDTLALGREGGHSTARILHARGDATGAECSRALVAAVRAQKNVTVLDRLFVVDFLTVENRCVGVLARRDEGDLVAVFARAVVVAAGGAGRLYRETSNVRGATGDGIAAAYRAGAELQDLEFVQFHPTTLYLAGTERTLVTEAVRGEGGYLVDDRGERFLLDVHPAAELAPRDVVSQAIVHHLARPNVQGVFLDLRHWTAGHAERRFPGLFQSCARYGLDPARDPIPVRPAAHYFIGGIRCDIDGRTNLEGLYACGEASCTGLHGANRLASNSLLEGLVLGARAGIAAAATRSPRFDGDVGHAAARRTRRGDAADWLDLKESLESIMWRHVSIVRDADGLQQAAEKIAQWRHFTAGVRLDRRIPFETLNLLQLAGMVVAAAARREESRGTHLRSDRPERDDARYLGHFRWQRGAEPRFERLSERHG